MKKLFIPILALIFTMGFAACENEGPVEDAQEVNEETSAISEDASEFMTKAANSGMFEVEAGRLAMEKGSTQMVKDYGSRMVNDHTDANNKLKDIASRLNVTLPTMLTDDKQDKLNELREKTGVDFDEAYMDMMEKSHNETIDMFQDAAEDGDIHPDVRQFATNTLPVLQSHMSQAKMGEEHTDELKH